MKNKKTLYSRKRTFLIILGLFVIYVAQVNPSAVLTMIMEEYHLTASQGSFGISVIYFPTIVFSLIGASFQRRMGLKVMFTMALLSVSAGILLNLLAVSYPLFLLGRVFYGIGYGLSIPFIGAAITEWYEPRQRVLMNTANAVAPYFGNVAAFGLTVPFLIAFQDSWKMALAVWGIAGVFAVAAWIMGISREEDGREQPVAERDRREDIYGNLLVRKEIIILLLSFALDFFCYSIMSSLLPTIYQLEYGLDIALANRLTMLFPIGAIIGSTAAYGIMKKTQRRKTILWLGQLLKGIGSAAVWLGGTGAVGILGIICFGVGSCLWTPAMYVIPAELPDMSPARVGGAFSLITSSGFAAGILSPVIASWIGEAAGLKTSVLLCAIPSFIAMGACLMIEETGPGRDRKKN